jgi:nuclear pore complex protein Nup155
MKLLLLHVSEHQDSHLLVSIWRYIFDRCECNFIYIKCLIEALVVATAESLEDEFSALSNLVERLGRKYYPSESAFPLGDLLRVPRSF